MNKIQKLLLFSLLIVTTNSLFCQNYNYKDTIIYIPESEINYLKNGKTLNEPLYFSEKGIRYIPTTKLDTVPSSIAEILYAHIRKNLIIKNQYDTLKTQREINRQKKPSLYYMGFIPINSEYESYIFMINNYYPSIIDFPSEDAYLNREFYMFNIQKERLLSMYKIASYMLNWGHVFHSYTIIELPDILIRKSKFEDSSLLYEREEDREKAKERQKESEEQSAIKYKIDAQGYIELLSE